MKIDAASSRTVVTVAALLLVGASLAVTQPSETGITATVCVKSNGQMRMPASNATGCGPSERLVRWVVDGDVNDVRVGTGLVATREGGVVNLALDPSVLECENCNDGKVFAGFNDGPGEIPPGALPVVVGDDYEPQQIAALDLPAGDYAIFAKLLLVTDDVYGAFVRCRLTAGVDSDAAYVVLEDPNGPPGSWGGASADVMNLQVVHHFDTPGVVVLSCADGFPIPLAEQPADGLAQFRHLKITAMKVSSISNVALSN